MNTGARAALSGAMESSLAVRAARRAGAGSVLRVWLAAAREWSGRTQSRILIGLGGTTTAEREARELEALMTLTADSRLISLLESWIAAVAVAGQSSWARRAFSGPIELDLCGRIRLAGWALVVAVIAHAVFFLALGMTVTWIGWTARIALLAFGVALFGKPGVWASAWLDRRR